MSDNWVFCRPSGNFDLESECYFTFHSVVTAGAAIAERRRNAAESEVERSRLIGEVGEPWTCQDSGELIGLTTDLWCNLVYLGHDLALYNA